MYAYYGVSSELTALVTSVSATGMLIQHYIQPVVFVLAVALHQQAVLLSVPMLKLRGCFGACYSKACTLLSSLEPRDIYCNCGVNLVVSNPREIDIQKEYIKDLQIVWSELK